MRFFAFLAGFFRNAAPESSTRLVGILAAAVGLALAGVLIYRSSEGHEITWTDIVVVASVMTFSCTALGLRSPFPTELFAPAGTKVQAVQEQTTVAQSTTTVTTAPAAP